MVTMIYDGTFEGLLSVVFEVYEYKFSEVNILPAEKAQANVFNNHHTTITNEDKAIRVFNGLKTKISVAAINQLYRASLSELPGIEQVLLCYIQYVFNSKLSVEYDYSNAAVLKIRQTDQKVRRERHRMEAFIRFQLTKDGLYYAVCQPDFNVLPLLQKHFKDRYADQRWLIYDATRRYGIYYDLNTVETIQLTFNAEAGNGNAIAFAFDEDEELYQRLWQQYFKSVNISARKNTKLHIQHMPRRYWRYLTEKHTSQL